MQKSIEVSGIFNMTVTNTHTHTDTHTDTHTHTHTHTNTYIHTHTNNKYYWLLSWYFALRITYYVIEKHMFRLKKLKC